MSAPSPTCPGRSIACASSSACASGFAAIATAVAASLPNACPRWRPPGLDAPSGWPSAGVRLGHAWNLRVSRNTLLRLLRPQPLPDAPTPRVLGVDDFALRKRQTYGTVLIALERRQPVALLPDREGDTCAQWLQAHPGVAVITRDRSKAYADGARHGAPQATQVAERFHLFQNVAETLPQIFNRHSPAFQVVNEATGRTSRTRPAGTVVVPVPPSSPPRHAQLWALRRQGWTGQAIAQQLRMGKRTVFRYLRSPTFAERTSKRRGHSMLNP